MHSRKLTRPKLIYSFIYLFIDFHQMNVKYSRIQYNEIQLTWSYYLNKCSMVAE